MSLKIRVSDLVPKGTVVIMADYEHPEIHLFEDEVPESKVIFCYAEDEEMVRDAVALHQERPKWWEDLQIWNNLLNK